MTRYSLKFAAAFAGAALMLASSAFADDIALTYKDHKFSPAEIQVEAGKPFSLKVKNEDAKAIEIESKTMRIEKIVAGGSEAVIKVRALKAGSYDFFNEFHEESRGKVVAK